jgi:hypothetical protein
MHETYNNTYSTFTFQDKDLKEVTEIVKSHIQSASSEDDWDEMDDDCMSENNSEWQDNECITLNGNTLTLTSNEYGFFDADDFTDLLQILVDREFLPDGTIITWGYTCSRPIIDEYGGGAACIKRNQAPRILTT